MKNGGSDFENHVEIVCDAYRIQRLADIEKVAPPVKVFGMDRQGMARVALLENPYLDFIGTWTERDGRAIHLEVKTTAEPRLPVGNKAGVDAEQLANLRRWYDAGAAVGVLWLHGEEVRFVTLTAIQHAMEVDSRKSVPWQDAYPCPPGDGLISFDFLAMLRVLFPA